MRKIEKLAALAVGVVAGLVLSLAVNGYAAADDDAKVSAAVGQPKRFGLGQGRYDNFRPDPKRSTCTPIHDKLGDEWVRAEGTHWQGDTFDLIGGGSRVVGANAMVSVGGTTYVIWPCAHGIGTS